MYIIELRLFYFYDFSNKCCRESSYNSIEEIKYYLVLIESIKIKLEFK